MTTDIDQLLETMPEAPEAWVDATIGRYVFRRLLGAGSMGIVVAAHDPELDREVAIKIVTTGEPGDARPIREAQVMARLSHSNVVQVYEVIRLAGRLAIVMELVEGDELEAWQVGKPWRDIVAAYVQASRGLAAAHRAGIVHRDFKPSNALIDRNGVVRVTDFGLAKHDGKLSGGTGTGVDATYVGPISGTPGYMSPEQFRSEVVDSRSDQFSFCVALYAALYNQRPFSDTSNVDDLRTAVLAGELRTPADRRGVPRRIHDAIVRGLAIAPDRRHPSMDALVDALVARRRRWPIVAASAAVLVGIVVAFGAAARGSTEPEDPCIAAAAAVDTVWNETSRSAARNLLARDPFIAEDLAWYENFAAQWRKRRIASCEQALAERSACLDRALATFKGVIETAIEPDNGPTPWPRVPSLIACDRGQPAPSIHAVPAVLEQSSGRVLSPDGSQLAAVFGGQLHIMDLDGKDRAVHPARADATVLSWPSPDRVIVGSGALGSVPDQLAGSRTHVVIAIDPATGSRTEIPIPDDSIALSDRADRALLVSGGDLFVASPPMAAPKRIATLPCTATSVGYQVSIDQAIWSPAGRRVAIICTDRRHLVVVDPERGVYAARLRAPVGWTAAMVRWLSEDEVAFTGQVSSERGAGIYRARLDDTGKFVEPPELWVDADASITYHPFSFARGRMLAQRTLTRGEVVRFGERVEVVPRAHGHVDGISDDGARLLVSDDHAPGLFTVATAGYQTLGRSYPTQYAIEHGGEAFAFAKNRLLAFSKTGLSEVAAMGAASDRRLLASFEPPPKYFAYVPSCSRDGETCLASWFLANSEFAFRVIRKSSVGPLRTIARDHVISPPAVSPDGRELVVRGRPGFVEILDVETGLSRREVATPVDANCINTQFVTWGPRSLFATMYCVRGTRVFELVEGKPPRLVYEDPARWIAGIAVAGNNDLYGARMDEVSDTVLVE